MSQSLICILICACTAILPVSVVAQASDGPKTDVPQVSPQKKVRTVKPLGLFDSRTINADVELGFLVWNDAKPPTRFFGRVMIGMLRAKDPYFASINLGLDIGGLRSAAIGAHFVIQHLINGFFAHGFYSITPRGTSMLGASVGWSIIGVEAQLLPTAPHDRLMLFKLIIPFGIGLYGRHKMGRDVEAQSLTRNSSADTP